MLEQGISFKLSKGVDFVFELSLLNVHFGVIMDAKELRDMIIKANSVLAEYMAAKQSTQEFKNEGAIDKAYRAVTEGIGLNTSAT